MLVIVHCSNPACRQEYRVTEAVLGKSGKCKACGTTFVAQRVEGPAPVREVSLSILNDGPPLPTPAASPPPVDPPSAESLTAIGRFELRERLGAGAFGTVYRAYDPQLDREVAIKVPHHSVLKNPKRVERFLREARAAARLRHPNIVPVYDAGQTGRQLYIASAFVKGHPLSDIVDDGGIELKKAATIVRALAEGLAYAHQEGVVHRDVKPANVMLDDIGQPLLMDFGLAAQVDSVEEFLPPEPSPDVPETHDASRLTRAGAVMGTPSYMAPEIAGGLKGEAKPASDQYALGVVLFELLTGRTPFEGPPVAVLHQAIHDAPPSPAGFRKDLPKDLETICLKAMAKGPADRYVTCYAMAEDLRRWLDGEPIRARRLGIVERARRWMKKEPKLALLSGGMAASVAIIIGLLAVMWLQSSNDRDAFAADRDRVTRERDDTEARRKAEQETAGKALADQQARDAAALAAEKVAAGDPNAAHTLLAGIPADHRGPGWPFLAAQAGGFPEFRRFLPTNRSLGLAFQIDNRHLLQVADSGWLLVWDLWTDRKVRQFAVGRTGLTPQTAAMSADGKRIAIVYGRGYNTVPPPPPGVVAPTALPGGKAPPPPPKPEIVIWDGEGKVVRSLPVEEANYRIALNREGTLLAVAGSPGSAQKLALWNVDSGDRVAAMDKELAAVPFPLGPIAFSPDGKVLATLTVQEKGEIRAWEIATGEEKFAIKDRGGDITHLEFSPDGSRLAAAGGAELEGPEYTTERTVCELQTRQRQIDVNGQPATTTYAICVSREVKEKHVGYRNPRLATIAKPVCVTEKRARTVSKPMSKTYTAYEERTVNVEKDIDGKKQTVTEKVKVPVQKVATEMVATMEEYEVQATKHVFMETTAVDPTVRVWSLDGVLQTKIVESDRILALAWRGDGALLATACDRNDPCNSTIGCKAAPSPFCGEPTGDHAGVNFWDPTTGQLAFALPASTPQIGLIAFSPDHKHIAASSLSGITVWSTESRSLLATQRCGGPINGLLFSPDSSILSAFSKCEQSVRLWDIPGSWSIARFAGVGPGMEFLPNLRFLADKAQLSFGGGYGYGYSRPQKSLGRWTARDGAAENHPGNTSSVWAYSPDGNRFVAGNLMSGAGLTVFDGQTGAKICDLAESKFLGYLQKVQVSRDGSRVSALGGSGEALLWDGSTGKVLAQKWNGAQADLAADGRQWAVAMRPAPLFYPAAPPAPPAPVPAPVEKKKAQAPANESLYFVVQKKDAPAPLPQPPAPKKGHPPVVAPAPPPPPPPPPPVLLFDGDGKERHQLPNSFANSYSELSFDSTGKFLIGVADEAWVRVWNTATGQLVTQQMTSDSRIAISPDGRFLAYHSAESLTVPKEMPKPDPKVMPKKITSRDTDLPAEFVAVQPAVPGAAPAAPYVPAPVPAFPAAPAPMAAPSGRPGMKHTTWVNVLDLATGKVVWQTSVTETDHGEMTFSADGTRLALATVNDRIGSVQVWDTAAPADGQLFKYQTVGRYTGHVGAVHAVAFSPDGKFLASGGEDRTVKIWKLPAAGESGPGAVLVAPPMMMPALSPGPAPLPSPGPAPLPSPGPAPLPAPSSPKKG